MTISERAHRGLVGLAVGLFVVLHLPVLDFGFVYDDPLQILNNPAVTSLEHLHVAFTDHVWWFDPKTEAGTRYYRPLFVAYLAFCYQLFGPNAAGFHLLSLAWHLACSLLVYRFARGLQLPALARLGALVVFLLHPVQIQASVWISAVSDPMLAVFTLLACSSFSAWLRQRDRLRLLLTLVLILASVWTLERGVVAAVPLLLLSFFGPELSSSRTAEAGALRSRVRRVVTSAAWLAVPLALALLVRRLAIGPVAASASASVLRDSVLTAPSVALRYLRMLVFPSELALVYPERFVTAPSIVGFVFPLVIVVAAFSVCQRLSRGNARRLFLLWSFVLTLAPVLVVGVLPGHAIVQDRYLYLPLCFLAPWACDVIGALRFPSFAARWAPQTVLGVVVALLVVLNPGNLAPYRDEQALYARALAVAPDNPQMLMTAPWGVRVGRVRPTAAASSSARPSSWRKTLAGESPCS